MEFDKETPVSDEERRLAETKKLTLQPVHADVAPDEMSDGETVARHLAGPAIANAPNDTEQDTRPVMPSKELLEAKPLPPRHMATLITTTALVTLVAAALCGSLVWWLLSL